jgi:nitroreductase
LPPRIHFQVFREEKAVEVMEALHQRRSIRAFSPRPVPRELVVKILEAARWSPSWGNIQPWELVVASGDTVRRLTADMAAAFSHKVPPRPDVPMPETLPDVWKARYVACAAGLFGTMGLAREDKAGRLAHLLNMTRAYGAPVIIYVTFKAELQIPYAMFDLGAVTHALCLAAWDLGLGTCIEAQLAHYPDLVRRHLGLEATHRIVVGVALGYPDPAAPANAFRTDRLDLEAWVRWVDYPE